jgi:hypothetical protein
VGWQGKARFYGMGKLMAQSQMSGGQSEGLGFVSFSLGHPRTLGHSAGIQSWHLLALVHVSLGLLLPSA